MQVDTNDCTGCGLCVECCPVGAIHFEDDLPFFNENCVRCGVCESVCPVEAISGRDETPPEALICGHCMVGCAVRPGFTGACGRYVNRNGALERDRSLEFPALSSRERCLEEGTLREPLVTAVGAGTTYPDYVPVDVSVESQRFDVDVVTTVSEAPLTMSTVSLKIDTKIPIGDETARVRHGGIEVGHVTTPQYGAKMIHIGGSRLIGALPLSDSLKLTSLMTRICNREPFRLTVDGGATLDLSVGSPPVVNGIETPWMEVGCGTAILGLFGDRFKGVADEVVVLDADITCLVSDSHVGRLLGFKPSGIRLAGKYAGKGRYHPRPGPGWGGTEVTNPLEALNHVDVSRVFPGMRVLVVEVTGEHAALLEADRQLRFREVELTTAAVALRDVIHQNRERAVTSAMFIGGAGGSARAGITNFPVKLNRGIQAGRIKVSVAGVPAFVFPGGGITFMVDVGAIEFEEAFGWVPIPPAVVVPMEYTMTKQTYFEMGGHRRNLRPLSDSRRADSATGGHGLENRE